MDSESWFKHGKEVQLERIIAILESELNDNCGMCNYDCGELIALIKAEQC